MTTAAKPTSITPDETNSSLASLRRTRSTAGSSGSSSSGEVTASPDEDEGEAIAVVAEHAGRADAILAAALPEFSRTRLQALIRAGAAELNGAALADPGRKVVAGDRLSVSPPEPEPADPVAEKIRLDILYEDAAVVVLMKPAGLVVHPGAGNPRGTLVNALLHHCGASLSGIGGVLRPGIVHRLDKDTSGVMVVAKSDRAHKNLAAQFADHGRTGPLRRRYDALAWGEPRPADGTVDRPLGRHPSDRQRFAVRAGGREAITHYATVERFAAASLVSCVLETGRTHQIRVHMAALGNPLMGDPLYAAGVATKASLLPAPAQAALSRLGRQALHAADLVFAHPLDGREMAFSVPPPADMAALLQALRGGAAGPA